MFIFDFGSPFSKVKQGQTEYIINIQLKNEDFLIIPKPARIIQRLQAINLLTLVVNLKNIGYFYNRYTII